ncbi:unnamed protein product [Parascedosporium putredinis]|uniref:Uncharacterized protein n=1 Tax=Parascedosporium putredinis TaxID=1442378 RepID=A0A9P1MB31_9PEZI|nr:unnamed protein product [Parascedosporium putredinis]CAI7998759.1 unnamed protein product [Parascedosporium putredinis]
METAGKAKRSKNPGCCVCGDKAARGCPGCVDAKDKNGGQGEIQHYCIVDSFPIGQDGHRHVCEKMYNRLYLARASYLCKSMVIQGRMIMFKKAVDAISGVMDKPHFPIKSAEVIKFVVKDANLPKYNKGPGNPSHTVFKITTSGKPKVEFAFDPMASRLHWKMDIQRWSEYMEAKVLRIERREPLVPGGLDRFMSFVDRCGHMRNEIKGLVGKSEGGRKVGADDHDVYAAGGGSMSYLGIQDKAQFLKGHREFMTVFSAYVRDYMLDTDDYKHWAYQYAGSYLASVVSEIGPGHLTGPISCTNKPCGTCLKCVMRILNERQLVKFMQSAGVVGTCSGGHVCGHTCSGACSHDLFDRDHDHGHDHDHDHGACGCCHHGDHHCHGHDDESVDGGSSAHKDPVHPPTNADGQEACQSEEAMPGSSKQPSESGDTESDKNEAKSKSKPKHKNKGKKGSSEKLV